jgi:hypothetical protein
MVSDPFIGAYICTVHTYLFVPICPKSDPEQDKRLHACATEHPSPYSLQGSEQVNLLCIILQYEHMYMVSH